MMEHVGMDDVAAARVFAEYASEVAKRAPRDGEIERWLRALPKEQLLQYASATIFVAALAVSWVGDLLAVLQQEYGMLPVMSPEGLIEVFHEKGGPGA